MVLDTEWAERNTLYDEWYGACDTGTMFRSEKNTSLDALLMGFMCPVLINTIAIINYIR